MADRGHEYWRGRYGAVMPMAPLDVPTRLLARDRIVLAPRRTPSGVVLIVFSLAFGAMLTAGAILGLEDSDGTHLPAQVLTLGGALGLAPEVSAGDIAWCAAGVLLGLCAVAAGVILLCRSTVFDASGVRTRGAPTPLRVRRMSWGEIAAQGLYVVSAEIVTVGRAGRPEPHLPAWRFDTTRWPLGAEHRTARDLAEVLGWAVVKGWIRV